MPKKDAAKNKSSSAKKPPSKGDAVRSAAAQAIEAAGQAGFTRERAQQLADELVSAASRFRETLEELRPAGTDELRALRERVAALEQRVAALEKPTARKRTASSKPRGSGQRRGAAQSGGSAESGGSAQPPASPEPPAS